MELTYLLPLYTCFSGRLCWQVPKERLTHGLALFKLQGTAHSNECEISHDLKEGVERDSVGFGLWALHYMILYKCRLT